MDRVVDRVMIHVKDRVLPHDPARPAARTEKLCLSNEHASPPRLIPPLVAPRYNDVTEDVTKNMTDDDIEDVTDNEDVTENIAGNGSEEPSWCTPDSSEHRRSKRTSGRHRGVTHRSCHSKSRVSAGIRIMIFCL